MIGLRVTVPIASWRKGAARELLETEALPPPATCYGALLAYVGETDRERHRNCRVTAGLLNTPGQSTVLRTLWRIKKADVPQGNEVNARPDFQQIVVGADLIIWCDSAEEAAPSSGLEARVRSSFKEPGSIERFGGWSLGESTHLINDAWLLDDGQPPSRCQAFLLDDAGDLTLPVWVDHVGSMGTVHAVGRLVEVDTAPPAGRLPTIRRAPHEPPSPVGRSRKTRSEE